MNRQYRLTTFTFLLFGTVLVALFATNVGCSSTTKSGPADDDDSSDSTPVDESDCTSRCVSKVGDCGYSETKAEEGCEDFCASVTKGQLTCFLSKSCSALEKASTLEALCPAAEGDDDDDKKPSENGQCDGKPFCKDAQTRATCEIENGIEVTDATACAIGTCDEGKCGACKSDATCENKTTICYCADGTNVAVALLGSCDDGFCSISLSSGGPFCQDHGGPDEDRGDAVYHCSLFWQDD